MSDVSANNYEVMDSTMTAYAPKIFHEIIEIDSIDSEMTNSLNLTTNFKRIVKAGVVNIGKSGGFFFFSSDNKVIIKTGKESELEILLKILSDYVKHDKYHLILMKNVNGFPSACIERKYDLKGSTAGRFTIDPMEDVNYSDLKFKETLKDIDFNKYEKKLWVPEEIKGNLFETISKDSEFLSNHGLIDYSLIVYIIKKSTLKMLAGYDEKLSSRTSEKIKSELPVGVFDMLRSSNDFGRQRLQSLKHVRDEVELTYHMGIIDYPTEYNCKKAFEKNGKRLVNLNLKCDSSVQSPMDYVSRFMKYIQKILLT